MSVETICGVEEHGGDVKVVRGGEDVLILPNWARVGLLVEFQTKVATTTKHLLIPASMATSCQIPESKLTMKGSEFIERC